MLQTYDDCDPPGWTRSDWTCQNYNAPPEGSGFHLKASSLDTVIDAVITSDWYDAAGCDTVTVQYATEYDDYVSCSTDFGYVDYTFDGVNWTNAQTLSADVSVPQTVDLDKSTWGPEHVFKIRFRYVGDGGGYWKVDNIQITGS